MLHGMNGGSQSPLKKCSMSAGCHLPDTTASQASPTRVEIFFFFLPSDSCSCELKASSVMQRFGPESGAGEGRAVHGRMDGWMKAAQIKRGGISFLLIDLTVQQRNPLIFTWLDPFIELGENVTICRNVSCLNVVENPSFNPGFLFLKENRSSNHVTSYNGFELLNIEHGNSCQSIMPRAHYL